MELPELWLTAQACSDITTSTPPLEKPCFHQNTAFQSPSSNIKSPSLGGLEPQLAAPSLRYTKGGWRSTSASPGTKGRSRGSRWRLCPAAVSPGCRARSIGRAAPGKRRKTRRERPRRSHRTIQPSREPRQVRPDKSRLPSPGKGELPASCRMSSGSPDQSQEAPHHWAQSQNTRS